MRFTRLFGSVICDVFNQTWKQFCPFLQIYFLPHSLFSFWNPSYNYLRLFPRSLGVWWVFLNVFFSMYFSLDDFYLSIFKVINPFLWVVLSAINLIQYIFKIYVVCFSVLRVLFYFSSGFSVFTQYTLLSLKSFDKFYSY